MTSFGDKLRQAREKKGISLTDISQTTKIGTRQLKALEEEEFEKLPGGIFNKGFVRSYARCVGLNEEDAVADYLATIQESPLGFRADIGVTDFPLDREPVERAQKRNSPLVPVLVGLAILAIILAGLAYWRWDHAKSEAPATLPHAAAMAENTTPISPPVANLQTSAVTSKSAAPTTAAPPDSTGRAGIPTVTHSATQTAPPESLQAPTPSGAKLPGGFVVRIHSRKPSWIMVARDGGVPQEMTLTADTSVNLKAREKLTVKLGNAGGVEVSHNGEPISFMAVDGQVKTLTFDASGLRQP